MKSELKPNYGYVSFHRSIVFGNETNVFTNRTEFAGDFNIFGHTGGAGLEGV
jgi:hypothetical protein